MLRQAFAVVKRPQLLAIRQDHPYLDLGLLAERAVDKQFAVEIAVPVQPAGHDIRTAQRGLENGNAIVAAQRGAAVIAELDIERAGVPVGAVGKNREPFRERTQAQAAEIGVQLIAPARLVDDIVANVSAVLSQRKYVAAAQQVMSPGISSRAASRRRTSARRLAYPSLSPWRLPGDLNRAFGVLRRRCPPRPLQPVLGADG